MEGKSQTCSSIDTKGPARNIRGEKHRFSRALTSSYDQGGHFFTTRVIPHWNKLLLKLVRSLSNNAFKNNLADYLNNKSTHK